MTGRLCALGAMLALLTPFASAQDALLAQAREQLNRRDAAGAFALLAPHEASRAGDARFDYLMGVAALDAGHVTRAIFALERVVQCHPEDMLARAELGRAYLAAGDAQAAREQLQLARSGKLPPAASAAIERVIGMVDQVAPAAAGPQLSGYVQFGAAYDSNVNSATPLGEFAIPAFGGIVFETSAENRQRRDLTLNAAGGVSAEATLTPTWRLVGAANLRAGVNREVRDMDTIFVDVTAGLRHTAGKHSQVLALQSSTAWLGASPYRTANGLIAQWQSELDSDSQASLFSQWSRQEYASQAERDTDRLLLGVGGARQHGLAGPLAYGSAYLVQERVHQAAFANFGHRGGGIRVGIEQRLGPASVGFAEWQYEQRRYGGSEPFFDVRRRDHQKDLAVGLRYTLDPRWQVIAQARRSRAGSNVVLYDYSRNVLQITAHRSFQ
ncbi:surface lipoprotein assembly modifier [Roseateles sp. DC23W]|uniref:Surface lipoprotein assembly modifier n=1 Tax=Pelomonas dachongensis TaxID=3299029 RepID=A0ABW7ERA7_9BURK